MTQINESRGAENNLNIWLILFLACLASFVGTLNWLNFTPLLVPIMKDFSLNYTEGGLLVTAAMILPVIVQFGSGVLADRYGGGKVMVVILTVIILPALLTGFARSYSELFAARLFIGISAGTFPVGSKFISQWFPKNRMGFAQGAFGGTTAAGLAFSAFIMPRLADMFDWRTAFIFSSLTLVPVTIIFLYLFVGKYSAGPRISTTKISFTCLRSPQTWYIAWLNFSFFGMYTGANSWLPSYFHEQFQVSTVVAGTLISVGLVLGAFARPSGGFVADKIQKKIILIFSVLMLAVFYSVIGLGLNITLSFVAVIIVAWFVMFGAGALFRIPPLLFDKEVGTVVGMASTFGLFLGGFVMPPIEGFLIDTTHSYASVFYLLGIISLINIIGAIKIKQV